MQPLNTLVLGVGGNVSQSIQKALALSTLPTRVVAACISAEAAGLYLADRAYISPLARSDEFVPWLLDVCEREKIDVVLSGSELVLEVLAPAAATVRERTGASLLSARPRCCAAAATSSRPVGGLNRRACRSRAMPTSAIHSP